MLHQKIVITGGPGTGKTTIIDILAQRGFVVVPEAARMVLEKGYTRDDLETFQNKVAEEQLRNEDMYADMFAPMFLDRSIIDGHAYAMLGSVESPQSIEQHARHRYDKVFLLEPLTAYNNDSMRFEDRDMSLRVHEEIKKSYIHFGYTIIPVPVYTPDKRCDFILEKSG